MSSQIFHSKVIINAPAQMVWDIITNHQQFSLIDKNYINIDNHIVEGKYITINMIKRKYQAKVCKIMPIEFMVWEYSWPFKLYNIIITFHVIAKDDQTSELHIEEMYSGYLFTYISKIITVSTCYAQLAKALKKYVEARN